MTFSKVARDQGSMLIIPVPAAATDAQAKTAVASSLQALGFEAPVEFKAGLAIARATQTVEHESALYAPVGALPFNTTANFDHNRWRLVAGNELRGPLLREPKVRGPMCFPVATKDAHFGFYTYSGTGGQASPANECFRIIYNGSPSVYISTDKTEPQAYLGFESNFNAPTEAGNPPTMEIYFRFHKAGNEGGSELAGGWVQPLFFNFDRNTNKILRTLVAGENIIFSTTNLNQTLCEMSMARGIIFNTAASFKGHLTTANGSFIVDQGQGFAFRTAGGAMAQIVHNNPAGDTFVGDVFGNFAAGSLHVRTAGQTRIQISAAGNVGIGAAPAAGAGAARVAVAGDVAIAGGVLKIGGNQVVGPRAAAVASPTGGAVVDAQARAAIDAIRNLLKAHGLTA